VREGEEEDFCCVVVGNKVDVIEPRNGVAENTSRSVAGGSAYDNEHRHGIENGNGETKSSATATAIAKGKWKVSEEDALSFLEELIPRSSSPTMDGLDDNRDQEVPNGEGPTQDDDAHRKRMSISLPHNGALIPQSNDNDQPINPAVCDEEPLPASSPPPPRVRSESISITINNNRTPSHSPRRHSPYNTIRGLAPRSRSRSAVRLSVGSGYTHGTKASFSSLATRETIYHTPSSSYFDVYESARSSPVPFPGGHGTSPSDGPGYGSIGRGSLRKGMRMNGRNDSTTSRGSRSSVSSSSAMTITQSLFARSSTANPASAAHPPAPPTPPPLQSLERRPMLFFTSAKTGEGVSEVFEYIARRVVVKWEWEAREWDEDGEWEGREDDTVRVGLRDGERDGLGMRVAKGCCT